jgi:hypothetical protein
VSFARVIVFDKRGSGLSDPVGHVSSKVKDLVVGSDLAFTDCGTHSLKGASGKWRLYAVGS